jgi:hypothetical protein
MELMDVLTEISTHDNSDEEGEEVEERAMPAIREALLEVQPFPNRWTSYIELYQCQRYKDKIQKKVKKLKKMIKRCALSEVMLNQQFVAALQQIQATYPDDGGRVGIHPLVACHHVINPEN